MPGDFTGVYTANIEASQSTLITALQITAGSGRPLYIVRWSITQRGSTASAMQTINLLRKTAGATVTSITPAPLNSNYPSAAATAGHSASAEGTDSTILDRRSFNSLAGIEVLYTPDEMPLVPAAGIIAWKWAAIPTNTTWVFSATFGEV